MLRKVYPHTTWIEYFTINSFDIWVCKKYLNIFCGNPKIWTTRVRIPELKRYKRNHKGGQKKIPYMVLNTLEYFIMIVSRSRMMKMLLKSCFSVVSLNFHRFYRHVLAGSTGNGRILFSFGDIYLHLPRDRVLESL